MSCVCWCTCSPAASASSLLLSSAAGCWMFHDVRGSISMSCRLFSFNMSIWLLLLSYLGMKQLLPNLKISLMISLVHTSSAMLRNTAIRVEDTYLGWLNSWKTTQRRPTSNETFSEHRHRSKTRQDNLPLLLLLLYDLFWNYKALFQLLVNVI